MTDACAQGRKPPVQVGAERRAADIRKVRLAHRSPRFFLPRVNGHTWYLHKKVLSTLSSACRTNSNICERPFKNGRDEGRAPMSDGSVCMLAKA
jgi:hypothetical protein